MFYFFIYFASLPRAGLNIAQVLFLHAAGLVDSLWARLVLLVLVTAPWLLRSRFPVNSFSANYTKPGAAGPRTLVGIMYRIKKYAENQKRK